VVLIIFESMGTMNLHDDQRSRKHKHWRGYNLAGILPVRHVELGGLLRTSTDGVGAHDPAVVNLLCSEGLPGSEGLDVDRCLSLLMEWARQVAWKTEQTITRFHHSPKEFNNSPTYFRLLVLVTVLQRDIGVHFNPACVGRWRFDDSQDAFLHGLLNGRRMGTCVSMPVLYVAIGKLLGYPMFLALTKGHVFARWDGDGERLNVEGTSRGFVSRPDAEYAQWPHPITLHEIEREGYLQSLSRAEELALFLGIRGNCLEDAGRWPEAREAYAHAVRFDPRRPHYQRLLQTADMRITCGRSALTGAIESHPPSGWLFPPIWQLNSWRSPLSRPASGKAR
jgi:hypothetical protein